MNQLRRATDRTPWANFAHIITSGDIGMVLVMGGLGLILWAAFGVWMFMDDLEAYAKMFPLGNGKFWVANYVSCGLAMWWLAAKRLPPLSSLLVGSWVCVIWSWSALARMTATATFQTGNATSVIYIMIGLLIIHRSAKR